MPINNLLVRPVTILNPTTTTTDRYNNTVLVWDTPASTPAKAWIAQTTTSEEFTERDATVEELAATFAADAPLTSRSRVDVDGVVYEVVGTPRVAWTPRGAHHTEVQLRAVTG